MQILIDMFGGVVSNVIIKKGLTDRYSETEYDKMICSLQEKGNKLEKQNPSNFDHGYSFYEWFHYCKTMNVDWGKRKMRHNKW